MPLLLLSRSHAKDANEGLHGLLRVLAVSRAADALAWGGAADARADARSRSVKGGAESSAATDSRFVRRTAGAIVAPGCCLAKFSACGHARFRYAERGADAAGRGISGATPVLAAMISPGGR